MKRKFDLQLPEGSHRLMSLALEDRHWPPGFLPTKVAKALIPALEKLVKRAASAELGRSSWKPNYPKEIQEDINLMTGFLPGSSVVEVVEVPAKQRKIDDEETLAQRAIARLAEGMRELVKSSSGAPQALDRGVLDAMDEVAESMGEIKKAQWTLYGGRSPKAIPVNATFRKRIQKAQEEPYRGYREITGFIHMVQDSPQPRASIQTADDLHVRLMWDERFRHVLSEAFENRKPVKARGAAVFNPKTGKIDELVADSMRLTKSATSPGVRIPEDTPKKSLLSLAGSWSVPKSKSTARVVKELRRLGWGD